MNNKIRMGKNIHFKLRENDKILASSYDRDLNEIRGLNEIKGKLKEDFDLPPEIVDDVLKCREVIERLERYQRTLTYERKCMNSNIEYSRGRIRERYESGNRQIQDIFGESSLIDFCSKMQNEIDEATIEIKREHTPKINELEREMNSLRESISSGDIKQLGEKQYTLKNPVSTPITRRVKDFYLDYEYYPEEEPFYDT